MSTTDHNHNAVTQIVTEYGFRQPNGDTLFEPVTQSGLSFTAEMVLNSDTQRGPFIRALQRKAKSAGVPVNDYVAGWGIVSRQTITITLDADDILTLDPQEG